MRAPEKRMLPQSLPKDVRRRKKPIMIAPSVVRKR
jgi:hypothetical protein